MKTFVLCIIMLVCATCEAGTKTYYNRNGSVQFRATTQGSSIRTTDSKGTFSGAYRSNGNSITQTQSGFKSARPNSTFSGKR